MANLIEFKKTKAYGLIKLFVDSVISLLSKKWLNAGFMFNV